MRFTGASLGASRSDLRVCPSFGPVTGFEMRGECTHLKGLLFLSLKQIRHTFARNVPLENSAHVYNF